MSYKAFKIFYRGKCMLKYSKWLAVDYYMEYVKIKCISCCKVKPIPKCFKRFKICVDCIDYKRVLTLPDGYATIKKTN